MTARSGFLLAFVLAMSVGRGAHAQAGSAEAEQLFRDGRELMKAKKYAEACDAFATSDRLDPAIATKMNLADCREKNRQIASAWGLFVDVERQTRRNPDQSAIHEIARERAAALEGRLSYLTISVPDDSRIEGLTILRNDVVLDEGLWNRATPVDGGTVRIVARAPGNEEWSTTTSVPAEKGKVSVDIPKLNAIRTVEARVADAPEEARRPGVPLPTSSSTGTFTGRRKVAVAVAVVGAAVVGVGVWRGLLAREDDAAAFDLCPDVSTPCADADEATRLSDRGATRGLHANIAFGVGAAAVVGAAILWWTGAPDDPSAPRETVIAPSIQSGFTGVTFLGSF